MEHSSQILVCSYSCQKERAFQQGNIVQSILHKYILDRKTVWYFFALKKGLRGEPYEFKTI